MDMDRFQQLRKGGARTGWAQEFFDGLKPNTPTAVPSDAGTGKVDSQSTALRSAAERAGKTLQTVKDNGVLYVNLVEEAPAPKPKAKSTPKPKAKAAPKAEAQSPASDAPAS
jgi:hypothetical protein